MKYRVLFFIWVINLVLVRRVACCRWWWPGQGRTGSTWPPPPWSSPAQTITNSVQNQSWARDNVAATALPRQLGTMVSGHKVVSYCIITISVMATPGRHQKPPPWSSPAHPHYKLCLRTRAVHATTLPRQRYHVFRPQSCWLFHYYYIHYGY